MKYFAILLMMASIQSHAIEVDWVLAKDGIDVNGGQSYAGCISASAKTDAIKKSATLIALGNYARTQNKAVSGEERLAANREFHTIISETSFSFLDEVNVLNYHLLK